MSDDPRKLWSDESRALARTNAIDEAKATSVAYGDSDSGSDELRSDWQSLIATARIKFPDHLALKFALTPKKRVICVAQAIGWPVAKIAAASGLAESTIYRYLGEDNAIEFIKAFEYNTGTRDAKTLIDNEQYASIQVLKDLRDDPKVSATTRADIAKWLYETKHGKAKEVRETKVNDLRALTEQLSKQDPFELDDESLNTVTRRIQKPPVN